MTRSLRYELIKSKHSRVGRSCWRTLLVANEWNELQTERMTNLPFTLMSVLMLLYGLDLKGLANFTPSSSDLEDSPFTSQSLILRLALVVLLFLALSAAQVRPPPSPPCQARRARGWEQGRGRSDSRDLACIATLGIGWSPLSHACYIECFL